jgi:hypothetical protein
MSETQTQCDYGNGEKHYDSKESIVLFCVRFASRGLR